MTSDIDLLPLPEKVEVDKHLPTGVRIYAYDGDTLKDYARANMEPLIAEIEALREQADKFKWQVRDTCVRAEKAESQLAALRKEREVTVTEALKYADKSGRFESTSGIELRKLADMLDPAKQAGVLREAADALPARRQGPNTQ